jgi:hypothetical protein
MQASLFRVVKHGVLPILTLAQVLSVRKAQCLELDVVTRIDEEFVVLDFSSFVIEVGVNDLGADRRITIKQFARHAVIAIR